MRIVLQQKDTGYYFRDIGSWTTSSSEAMDFLSSTAAIDFCVANRLVDLQLVFKFDEQRYDIVVPMLSTQALAEVSPANAR
ncbi:MAG TPA: hypothetical protein VN673_04590 [Clostridia bacterium]|nr:hypothetical protein [Clostridia bacterium]